MSGRTEAYGIAGIPYALVPNPMQPDPHPHDTHDKEYIDALPNQSD